MSRLIEIHAGDGVRRFDEQSLPLVIGTAVDAHIRLADGDATAAYVGESRGHLFLQPAATGSPVFHNDEPVTRSVWLKSGDTTRIGACQIRWLLSGRRLEAHLAEITARTPPPPLEPPVTPPQGPAVGPAGPSAADAPQPPEQPRPARRLRALVAGLFLLLLAGAAFVLLASPLTVSVSPAPERLSVSGFPPVVKFGDSYLGLPGSYTLRAEKPGYRPLQEIVEISSAANSYSFTLEKLPGRLDVTSTPAGATLLVDGDAVGQTPLHDLGVPAGQRRLRFEHPRYLPHDESVLVLGSGERQSLQVELEPAWVTVEVQSDPTGALLLVDGVAQGTTPLTQELLAGERRLTLQKETFTPREVTLTVVPGQGPTLPVYRLDPAPVTVNINSTPAGATITADGDYQGQTPLTITLAPDREHRLRLNLAGYEPASRKLKAGPGDSRTLDLRLEPQYGTVFLRVTPPQASLKIDGQSQESANGRFRLTTRPHTLELTAEGYQSLSRTVTPQAGYSQQLEITLPRPAATAQSQRPAAPAASLRTALDQRLILVQPKPFVMGASRKEAGRRANESEHRVDLQRGFYLSEREVTNLEFRKFQAQHASGTVGNRSLAIDGHPVVNVSWNDAARFLNWLSKADGLPPFYQERQGEMVAGPDRGIGYRLPTEAEWAYAARLAKRSEPARYPWPGRYPPPPRVANFADESARDLLPVVIEGYDDTFPATAPTGSFAADPAGFFDLGGNVAEWCHDYYAANVGGDQPTQPDPMGPSSGTHRVVRGSSWRDASITELRFSYRRYSRDPADDIGFRIARYAQ